MPKTAFTNDDPKPWAPIPAVLEFIKEVGTGAKVLDVGAGHIPFANATHTVDLVPKTRDNMQSIALNFRHAALPFPDKFFDFVFCRHTAEDMDDPLRMLEEVRRVGKRGYIETPSPLSEVCRGIDGGSPPWRGYNHHRHLIWEKDNTLFLLPKLVPLEHFALDDAKHIALLQAAPALGNTYLLWEGSFEIRFAWDEILLNYEKRLPGPTYQQAVEAAIEEGIASSTKFLASMRA